MKSKRFLSLLLSVCTAFCTVATVAACKDDDGDDTPPVQYSQPKSGKGEKYDRYEVEIGTYQVTIPNATAELIYSFAPSKVGTYAVYSSNLGANVDPVVSEYAASEHYFSEVPENQNDNKSTSDNNFYLEFEVRERYLYGAQDQSGNRVFNAAYRKTFGVKVNSGANVTFPATFDLTFKYVSDYTTPEQTYTTYQMQPSETLTKFPDRPTGTMLYEAPYNGTYVFNQTDGYYHVGTVDGPILMVAITKTPSRFIDVPFTQVADVSNSLMLQETIAGEIVLYNYYSFIYADYSAVVNTDGLYGLNAELKLFLDRYMAKWGDSSKAQGEAANVRWLAPCYYYA